MNKLKNTLFLQSAFTLAEVLITLGIIGVVAALTLPTLIQNQTDKFTETSLSKFYSIMNQAIERSVVDNGSYEHWDFTESEERDNEGNAIDKNDKMDQKFNKYFGKYLNIVSKKTMTSKDGRNLMVYYLADGSAFSFNWVTNVDMSFYPKKAEQCIKERTWNDASGSCFFRFNFNPAPKSNLSSWRYVKAKGMVTYAYNWDGRSDTLYSNSGSGCTPPGSGSYCTKIIEQNGWKIPKNYPKKIKY